MHGLLSHDTLVEVPAAVIWDVNRSLELGRLLNELLHDSIGRVEVVQGNGGVATILKITFAPGIPGPSYMKEIFTKVDDKMRVKESEVIEGGYKDFGFELCRYCLQIIEKDAESSIIRSSIEYEIDEKLEEIASQVTTKPMRYWQKVLANISKRKGVPLIRTCAMYVAANHTVFV